MNPSISFGNGIRQSRLVVMIRQNRLVLTELKLENTIYISADITNYNPVREGIDRIQEKLEPVDCLINNAGFGKEGEFTELSDEHSLMQLSSE